MLSKHLKWRLKTRKHGETRLQISEIATYMVSSPATALPWSVCIYLPAMGLKFNLDHNHGEPKPSRFLRYWH